VPHVLGVMIERETGARMSHVPYRGSAPMQAELLGGSLGIGFDVLPDTIENIRAGRLRAIAVSSRARQPMAPEVPTTAELGYPGIQIDNWVGLSGPANLPAPIVERLRAETVAALATPEVRRRLEERGITGEPLGPEAFAGLVTQQVREIGGLVAGLGMQLD
jgi:tripartite-type tricarboxylate transporter receptor subunit TctC